MAAGLSAKVLTTKTMQPGGWGAGDLEEIRRYRAISRPALSRVDELLMDGAQLTVGLSVLDVACGGGVPAIDEARRVGADGKVTGVDLSDRSIELAQLFAREEGVTNVAFRQADVHQLPFPDRSFDRVTCRFGAMFFRDLGRALSEAYRVLRPGGRLAWVVWGRIEDQPFFSATALVAMRHAGMSELPPEARQPFRFAEGGVLGKALAAAGFEQANESRHTVPSVWSATPEAVSQLFWASVAPPFQPIVDRLTEAQRADVVRDTAETLRPSYSDGKLRLTASVWLATGDKPIAA
jgi:SAM-dependent methyltransferase